MPKTHLIYRIVFLIALISSSITLCPQAHGNEVPRASIIDRCQTFFNYEGRYRKLMQDHDTGLSEIILHEIEKLAAAGYGRIPIHKLNAFTEGDSSRFAESAQLALKLWKIKDYSFEKFIHRIVADFRPYFGNLEFIDSVISVYELTWKDSYIWGPSDIYHALTIYKEYRFGSHRKLNEQLLFSKRQPVQLDGNFILNVTFSAYNYDLDYVSLALHAATDWGRFYEIMRIFSEHNLPSHLVAQIYHTLPPKIDAEDVDEYLHELMAKPYVDLLPYYLATSTAGERTLALASLAKEDHFKLAEANRLPPLEAPRSLDIGRPEPLLRQKVREHNESLSFSFEEALRYVLQVSPTYVFAVTSEDLNLWHDLFRKNSLEYLNNKIDPAMRTLLIEESTNLVAQLELSSDLMQRRAIWLLYLIMIRANKSNRLETYTTGNLGRFPDVKYFLTNFLPKYFRPLSELNPSQFHELTEIYIVAMETVEGRTDVLEKLLSKVDLNSRIGYQTRDPLGENGASTPNRDATFGTIEIFSSFIQLLQNFSSQSNIEDFLNVMEYHPPLIYREVDYLISLTKFASGRTSVALINSYLNGDLEVIGIAPPEDGIDINDEQAPDVADAPTPKETGT